MRKNISPSHHLIGNPKGAHRTPGDAWKRIVQVLLWAIPGDFWWDLSWGTVMKLSSAIVLSNRRSLLVVLTIGYLISWESKYDFIGYSKDSAF